uniref:Cytochrome P450 84A1-like n=2 Tax=Nelumbo nucifera TaxID=4432 RepID=A0A822YCV1_NELNU|nr:TPA_asm: hypothetical protein HUJ06_030273 [Nelumbo nucifera]
MVVVSTPEMARQVLQVQDNIFSNRPTNIAVRYLTYYRSRMVFAHYGPFWRQMRKIFVTKVDSVIRTVAGKAGSPVDVGELALSLMTNITYRAAFGSDIREGQEKFVDIIQELSRHFGAFNLGDFIPWLGRVDLQGFSKRLARARRSLDEFIDRIIDAHLAKRKNRANETEEDNDMVDDLLSFYDEDAKNGESEDLQGSINLIRDNIKAIIMLHEDVMFGGTETIASVIEWAMAEMIRSPADLSRVQQELVDVVGVDRRVQDSDFEKLTFLRRAIKETLRLQPPVPLLQHETADDADIGGYAIPKQAQVVVNAWAINRDPEAWDEPETFKPSRFLKEGAPDFKGSNFEFIPFCSGWRSCPGMQLALYTLELAVAHLLHCFTWDLPDGMKLSELDMNDVFGLTLPRAERLVAIPTPSLQFPLF